MAFNSQICPTQFDTKFRPVNAVKPLSSHPSHTADRAPSNTSSSSRAGPKPMADPSPAICGPRPAPAHHHRDPGGAPPNRACRPAYSTLRCLRYLSSQGGDGVPPRPVATHSVGPPMVNEPTRVHHHHAQPCSADLPAPMLRFDQSITSDQIRGANNLHVDMKRKLRKLYNVVSRQFAHRYEKTGWVPFCLCATARHLVVVNVAKKLMSLQVWGGQAAVRA